MELSANTPPRGGPAADATPVIKMMVARKSGIFFFETTWQIIINPPRFVPACDTPWIARPIIRTWEVDDVAQTAEPGMDSQREFRIANLKSGSRYTPTTMTIMLAQ